MHLDPNISVATILTFLAMIVGVIMAFINFRDKINKKADKDEIDRSRANQDLLLMEIKNVSVKLEELKIRVEEYIKKQDNINKDFWIMQSEHKKNH